VNKDEIIKLLSENKDRIKEFGVKKIGLFGSAVRNEITERSDIDLVVEFKENRGGIRDFAGLVEFLENLFGKEVDVLTPIGIETIRIKSVKEGIKKEIEYV